LYQINHNIEFSDKVCGVYNLTPGGEVSWYDFARFIVSQAQSLNDAIRLDVSNIKSISTVEYPLPAKRPLNSRLDNQKIRNVFGVSLPAWQVQATRVINELNL